MMTEGQADTSSNKDNSNSNRSTVSSAYNDKLENVLILQGGGSLGAFGCGVFKALANNNIKLDIVAGTSIGGINAAIIAGSKDEKHPEQMLEQFWLELSQSFGDLDKVTLPFSSRSMPKFVDDMLVSSGYFLFTPILVGSAKKLFFQDKECKGAFHKYEAAKILLQLCYFWK